MDDALTGVTEIVRGRDLLLSSPQQIHLRNLLFQSTDDLLKRETDSLTPQTVPLGQGYGQSGGGGLTVNPSTFNYQLSTINFFHHPLLCNAEGQRLCKRDKSLDLGYIRDKGTTPQEIIGLLAHLAGLADTPAPITPQELIPLFSWKKVPTEDILLDHRITL